MTILIWGTGEQSKEYMESYNHKMRNHFVVVGFIDNHVKDGARFFGDLPVYKLSDVQKMVFDKIVIMNQYERDILKQVALYDRQLLGRVWTTETFFQYCIDNRVNSFDRCKVLFYGNYMMYEYAEYRARYTFRDVAFYDSSDNSVIPGKYDYVFLCTQRLIDKETRLEEENILRSKLIRSMRDRVSEEMILGYSAWRRYLEYNRTIYGLNEKRSAKFYIIAVSDPIRGWGNLLTRFAGGIAYAKKKNMIPVIDMQNIKNQYLAQEKVGIHNAWEDFFYPLNEYSVDDAYNSKCAILCGVDSNMREEVRIGDLGIKMREDLFCLIEDERKRLFPEDGKVLGVIYRGTDYFTNVKGHPQTGSIDEYIIQVKAYMNKLNYSNVFLATEVENAIDKFKTQFGDSVSYTKQKRFREDERRILSTVQFDRNNDEYIRGVEYLTVLYLLSYCDSIIGTDTGTMRAAIMLNDGKYEHVIIL